MMLDETAVAQQHKWGLLKRVFDDGDEVSFENFNIWKHVGVIEHR